MLLHASVITTSTTVSLTTLIPTSYASVLSAFRYQYWDEDNSGALDKEEVVRALLKTFRMTSDQQRVQMMRNTIDAVWPIFDDDGSGTIEREEFLKPNDGLADTIVATLGLEVR